MKKDIDNQIIEDLACLIPKFDKGQAQASEAFLALIDSLPGISSVIRATKAKKDIEYKEHLVSLITSLYTFCIANENELKEVKKEHKILWAKIFKHTKINNEFKKAFKEIKAAGLADKIFPDYVFDMMGDISQDVKAIKGIVEANSFLPVKSLFDRGDEECLKEELSKNKVLLLRGISQCGKTFLARRFLSEMNNEGYIPDERNETKEAVRLLSRRDSLKRIVLLDDPFGVYSTKDDVLEDWKNLEDLTSNFPENRLLILTCKNDILKELKGSNEGNWVISGHHWHDLTVKKPEISKRVWGVFCKETNVEKDIHDLVHNNLGKLNPSELLQPGQLRYLSKALKNEIAGKDFIKLCRIARFNSKDIGKKISDTSNSHKKLFMALGLASTTIKPVKKLDLSFIISSSQRIPHLPGYDKRDTPAHSITPGYFEKGPFPEYLSNTCLSEEYQSVLDELESRGFIKYYKDEISFSHPDYYEAAKSVLISIPNARISETLDMITRGIFCLNTTVCLTSLNSLINLLPYYSTKQEIYKQMYSLIFEAMKSIFPSVRDQAVLFLLKDFSKHNKTEQEAILDNIKCFYVDHDNIKWKDGFPWIVQSVKRGFFDSLDYRNDRLDDLTDEKISEIMKDPNSDPLPQYGWLAVTMPNDDKNIFIRGLDFDEVFIRRVAAYRLVSLLDKDSIQILDKIFSDHPMVVAKAIKRIFEEWPNFSTDFQGLLLPYLKSSVSKTEIAVACNYMFFKYYNIIEETGDEPQNIQSYRIWGELFPDFLKHIPDSLSMNWSSHLCYITNLATNYLSPSQGLEIAEVWLNNIEKALHESLPNGDTLGATAFLLKSTGKNYKLREKLVNKIIGHSDTGFMAVSLRDFLFYWEELSIPEKDRIIKLLREPRKDQLWLQAVALTSENPPDEVVETILGKEDALTLTPKELLDIIPENLLKRCLQVYTGEPQPLWLLGLQSNTGNPWQDLIKEILKSPNHKLFSKSLDAMLWHVSTNLEWKDAKDIWNRLCREANPKLRETLFKHLKKNTIKMNTSYKDFWAIYFETIKSDNEYENAISNLVDKIEAIENNNHDLTDVFTTDETYCAALKRLPFDIKVFAIINDFKKSLYDIKRLRQKVDKFYEKKETTPRLVSTHDIVIEFLKEHEGDRLLLDKVEEIRSATIDYAFELQERHLVVEVISEDWTFLSNTSE